MKKALKILGIVLAVLLVAAGGLLVYVLVAFNGLWSQKYEVAQHAITVPADEASLAEGRRLLKARACAECHGEDLGGRFFLSEPGFGRLYARNLTTGRGGRVAGYTDGDLERAIRHGVTPDGNPLVFMPSEEFWPLSDSDLGKIIQAIRAQPPVDREPEPNEFSLIMKGLSVFKVFPIMAARTIDQQAPHPAPVSQSVSVDYGRYVAVTCTGCHGAGFSGGPIPGAPPSIPVPQNLTPAPDALGRYSEEQFITALRTGKRPEGTTINEFMPWKVFANMTDTELKALYAFLKSLPAKPFGER
jgi:cytochrome c553